MDAGNPSAADEIIAGAKKVVASHEREAMAGNLDGLVANAAEDIVVVVPGAPLVLGRDDFREFYGALLEAGSVEFKHEYAGSEVVGDAVVLHGVSGGTMTPTDGTPIPVENNFLLILKPDESGAMKLWRGAFAPPSMGWRWSTPAVTAGLCGHG
jgi:ketosteroid isomerase-like protein